MTRMTVVEEKDMAKGTRLIERFSANELVELSFLAIKVGGCNAADLDINGAAGSDLEKTITSRSSASLP